MKLKPIILKPWEVRAFNEGRKSQIRVPITPQPLRDGGRTPRINCDDNGNVISIGDSKKRIHCPIGKPGDKLYVKEAWRLSDSDPNVIEYASTRSVLHEGIDKATGVKWKSPSTMPFKYARFFPLILEVRAERVQDIRNEDAKAVGCPFYVPHRHDVNGGIIKDQEGGECWVCAYRNLWKSIYGPKSWNENHWVWVADVELTYSPDN